jgi:hypothetical protein
MLKLYWSPHQFPDHLLRVCGIKNYHTDSMDICGIRFLRGYTLFPAHDNKAVSVYRNPASPGLQIGS